MLLRQYISFLKEKINFEGESNTDITHLHGSILIWELMKYYEKYEQVDRFKESLKSLNVLSKEFVYDEVTLKNGMYLKGFCDALFEFDELFSGNVYKLERAILFNEGVPELVLGNPNQCTGSVFVISKMRDTYFFLNLFISELLKNNLHGCQILDLCLKFKYRLPEDIFCVLIKHLNKRLIKQISCWIVFGELSDPNDEFFIKHVDSAKTEFNEDTFDTSSVSSHVSSFRTSTSELVEEIYEIESSYLPHHVPYSLACKILNVGRLVFLLRHAPVYTKATPSSLGGSFGINEAEIMKTMKELEEENNYHLTKLEKVVNFVWISVNQQLKRLAEDVGGLFIHHSMLMDVYLLQRGDIMSDFVKQTGHMLLSDVKKTSVHCFNKAFKTAIMDAGSNLQSYSELLTFNLPDKSILPDGATCISALELRFKTPWPLHFIFSVDVMEKYNVIFRFLLELKCVRLNLVNTWRDSSQLELPTEILYIKYRMDLLLTNLESYVFLDVIQSENEVWEAAVKKAETFNDIKLLHMNFLTNIMINLFLLSSKEEYTTSRKDSLVIGELGRSIMQKKISELFIVCNQFCVLVKTYATNPQIMPYISNIIKPLRGSVKSIIKILRDSFKESDSPRLLLMRINYNNYYSPL